MKDLEDRLRATYTAVAEQTVVAELRTADEHVVVTLAAARQRVPLRRVGLSIAAALVLLAGLVAVTKGRHTGPADDSADGRPFAIPMYVPKGFALVQWSTGIGTPMASFAPTPASARVAELRYSGPDQGVIVVNSTAATAAPTARPESVSLASGSLAVVQHFETAGIALSWVQPGGAAVSITGQRGVTLADLTAMANSMWYSTPDGFAGATSKAGFGQHVFESWQPPGDRFVWSRVRLEGSLQGASADDLRISWFDGMMSTAEAYAACRGQQIDDSGRIVLFGPADVRSFIVTLPDGTLRRQPAGSPPWYPSAAFASIKIGKTLPEYYSKAVPVTCEEG